MNSKNIVLMSCWHDDNKGDSAIIIGTLNRLEAIPTQEITCISMFSEDANEYNSAFRFIRKKENVKCLSHPFTGENKLKKAAHYLLLSLSVKKFSSNNMKSVHLKLLEADYILFKGGHYIHSLKSLIKHLLPLILTPSVLFKKNKVILYGHSVGPFPKNAISRKLVSIILNTFFHQIYVRETLSYNALLKIGVNKDKILQCSDLAFSVHASTNGVSDAIIQENNLNAINFATITLRSWVEDNKKSAFFEMLSSELISILNDGIINKIVIFPQCLGPTEFEDDRIISKEFFIYCKELTDQIIYIEEDLSSEELVLFYKNASLIIGTRFHSVILSLVARTPAIAISYFGPKSKGIMNDLHLGNYVVDINDSIDPGIISKMSNIALNNNYFTDSVLNKLSEYESEITPIQL